MRFEAQSTLFYNSDWHALIRFDVTGADKALCMVARSRHDHKFLAKTMATGRARFVDGVIAGDPGRGFLIRDALCGLSAERGFPLSPNS